MLRSKCVLLKEFLKTHWLGSLLLLPLLLSLLTYQQTNAWAPVVAPPWTGDIQARADAAFAGSAFENWRDMNYAAANYDGGSVLFFVGDDTQFSIADNGSGSSSINGRLCRWYYDMGSSPGCNPLNSSYSLTTDAVYALHLTDTYKAANAPVVTQYTDLVNTGGGSLDPENNATPRCQPWDMACWFQSVIGNVVDTFQGLADVFTGAIQALGEWLANLIMPANADGTFDNRFTSLFTELSDGLTERLGVLLFPFQFLAESFNALLSVWVPSNPGQTTNYCTSAVGFGVPNLLGTEDVNIDMCGIEDTPIWEPMKILMRLAWVLGLVALLYHKYLGIVRGHEE